MTANIRHLSLLVAIALGIAGCGGSQPAAPKEGKHEEASAEESNRVHISAAMAEQSGVRVAAAGPGTIRDEHDVQGLLTPIEGRHARVVARFAGPVRAVRVGVGDQVRSGQTLAIVESNVSLTDYPIVAPFAGTVLSRSAAVGDLAGDTPLFEIADLSQLWVDIHLFGGDAQHIRAGLPVEVVRLSDGVSTTTTLDRILPGTATASQSTVARATVPNSDGNWRPGAAVRARVSVSEDAVSLAVPLDALQSVRGEDVVFVREGDDDYEMRKVRLGRRDGHRVEVLDGLKAGENVVVEQSYLIKADLEKSSTEQEE
ncbi:MAG: efflux RND transporter periplasmic adaptor subunit [Proteobacteria bacterium]|nr:efflux RND transporter periplasmic adaptor subunit [Pseudomonadota bacterium]